MKINKFWLQRKEFCDGDCNNCEAIRNRQVTVVLNALRRRFGPGVYEIVQHYCPNLTCCADCCIDDFCHDEGCELEEDAKKCAMVMKGKLEKDVVEWDPKTGKTTPITE